MTAAFDTLKYAKQLENAGVPKDQAEIHAEALRGVMEEQIMARFDKIDEALSGIRSDIHQLDNRLTRVDTGLEYLTKVVYGAVLGILLLLVRGFWSG